ncbi:uncharacterized protein LOC106650616 isoform X2 [Trichogramma pretiosum]|uniref:uncharacterized protein LOC106650616 isoform X2 n=1 Tax=Trichogramma pretiosum TaxID=7493 RepID=UPI0006C9CA64|nr:uncharacterized protein LOC106650616 isoform X2 [Trichogramma pretiosum]
MRTESLDNSALQYPQRITRFCLLNHLILRRETLTPSASVAMMQHHSQRYDHNASADCPVCPNTVENAEHVFFNCIRFEEGREKLYRQLQEVARPENIVQLMLADEKNWLAVATFAHSVITSLRTEEMTRRR